jgi:hypothetical protein
MRHEKENKTFTSSALIDVVIHKNDLINNCNQIDCPFSDLRILNAINQKNQSWGEY